jgi:hypothetical protein
VTERDHDAAAVASGVAVGKNGRYGAIKYVVRWLANALNTKNVLVSTLNPGLVRRVPSVYAK